MTHPLVPHTYRRVTSLGPVYLEPRSDIVQDLGFVQRRPYSVATPVKRHVRKVVKTLADYCQCDSWAFTPESACDHLMIPAANKAYERAIARLGGASSFGAALISERRGTFDTMVGTLLRLGRAAKAVKRLDLGSAARELGLRYAERTVKTVRRTKRGKGKRVVSRQRVFTLPTGREVAKNAANGWLFWSYGAKPLMDDLKNGCDVLTRPFPWERIKGGASDRAVYRYDYTGLYGEVYSYTYDYKVSIRCSVEVTVSNPNLWLANRMGLINPVAIINEGIPFSFVIDWFSNLSSWIGSMTDFVGLETARPITTKVYNVNYIFAITEKTLGLTTYDHRSWDEFWRTLDFPSPKLTFGFERFQWQRGLNAISLLVGFLPRKLPFKGVF